jgi:riboflavin-specific deaminase-like protein
MEFRELLPEARSVAVEDLLAAVEFVRRAPEDRPYTVVNFIASADGRATFHGRSGALGDDGDRAMFHGLRAQVDAVLVGTGTLAVERYGRIVKDPDTRHRRESNGLRSEPLAVVVTRSGQVPLDIPLFDEPESEIVVFSPEALEVNARARLDLVQLDPGAMTLVTVMRHLRAEYGVRSLLCEGGPTLFGALLHEGIVDELFLTVAPKLTGGGSGPAISSGSELSEPAVLTLEWVLERNGALYLRYAVT